MGSAAWNVKALSDEEKNDDVSPASRYNSFTSPVMYLEGKEGDQRVGRTASFYSEMDWSSRCTYCFIVQNVGGLGWCGMEIGVLVNVMARRRIEGSW